MAIIEFKNVTKFYEKGTIVLDDLSIAIEQGEFVTLIGPSGCGKTTFLKLINKLIDVNAGEIFVEGKGLNEWNPIDLRRNIGYVIQDIGLFPNMNIKDNITYVLEIMGFKEDKKDQRAKELINLVGMDPSFLEKYPRNLSGGQKQRIGLARALAADPDILLMDEPLGAVDEINRRELQDELLKIFSQLNKTIVFVTHDIQEAIKLGSRIVLFNDGKIEQTGTKEEMLFQPTTDFVRDFFGYKNFASYLNITTIGEVLKEKQYNDKTIDLSKALAYDDTIIKGIKLLIDHNISEIPVKKNDTVVGCFSFDAIKEKIFTELIQR